MVEEIPPLFFQIFLNSSTQWMFYGMLRYQAQKQTSSFWEDLL